MKKNGMIPTKVSQSLMLKTIGGLPRPIVDSVDVKITWHPMISPDRVNTLRLVVWLQRMGQGFLQDSPESFLFFGIELLLLLDITLAGRHNQLDIKGWFHKIS